MKEEGRKKEREAERETVVECNESWFNSRRCCNSITDVGCTRLFVFNKVASLALPAVAATDAAAGSSVADWGAIDMRIPISLCHSARCLFFFSQLFFKASSLCHLGLVGVRSSDATYRAHP